MKDSDHPDTSMGFIHDIYSRHPNVHKDYGTPADFPYVINTQQVPPILFYDGEHIDMISDNNPRVMKNMLSFAAYGHDVQCKPKLYLHMYVDASRDNEPDIYAHPNFQQVHYAYKAMLRKHRIIDPETPFAFPKPRDISGHVSTSRLRETLSKFMQQGKIWIGWDTRNDKLALDTVMGIGFEKRHNVRIIDLQRVVYDSLDDEGCDFDQNGRPHVLSLQAASKRFLKEEHTCDHSACGDGFAVMQIFSVLIERDELYWLRNIIRRTISDQM